MSHSGVWADTFRGALEDPIRFKLGLILLEDQSVFDLLQLNAGEAPTDKDREYISGLINFEIEARAKVKAVVADAINRLRKMNDATLITNYTTARDGAASIRKTDQWRDVTHFDARITEALAVVFQTEMAKRNLLLAEGNTQENPS